MQIQCVATCCWLAVTPCHQGTEPPERLVAVIPESPVRKWMLEINVLGLVRHVFSD